MSFLFPRVAFAPARCAAPARHEIVPFLSLFDDTFNEIHKAQRHVRRQFNPRFNVNETKEAYSLEGELPGIDQQDVSVEFTDEHTLTIKGRTETRIESGERPQAVEASQEKSVAAVEDGAATPSSEKSHHATVEDDAEEPANPSTATTTEKTVAAPTSKEATKADQTPQSRRWVSERSVGEFSRSFSFPARIDQEAVKASLKNGILSIVVPKAPIPESRRINIE